MEPEIREKIALKRYQIISPVLAEPKRAQNEYFRQQAQMEHDFPRYGRKKISLSTLKSWLRNYRLVGLIGPSSKVAPMGAGPGAWMSRSSRSSNSN